MRPMSADQKPAPARALLALLLLYALMLPVTAMVPVLAAFTLERYEGLSQFSAHLFMSASMLGALLGAPLAGVLSDRTGERKRLAIAALLVNGVILLLLAWGLKNALPYALVLGLRFGEGFAHMAALSLLMTLAAEQVSHRGLGARMGAVGAAISLGVATGAPLGGWLGTIEPLLVPAAGGLLSLLLAVLAAFSLSAQARARARLDFSALINELRQRKLLLIPLAFSFADRLTVGFIVSTLALYLRSQLQFEAGRIGLVMAAFLIPFSLLTWPAGHLSRYWSPLSMLISGSILYGAFLAALVFVPEGWMLPAMIGGGVIAALMYAPSLLLAAEYGGERCRASALAAFNMAGSLGFALGPLLSASLLAGYGQLVADPYPLVFFSIGMVEVVLALLVLIWWRRQGAATQHRSPTLVR